MTEERPKKGQILHGYQEGDPKIAKILGGVKIQDFGPHLAPKKSASNS